MMALWKTVTDVAGEIVEVGQGVQKFKVGDKVVALLTYSVSTTHLCLKIYLCMVKSFTDKIYLLLNFRPHFFVSCHRMEVGWLSLLQLKRNQ